MPRDAATLAAPQQRALPLRPDGYHRLGGGESFSAFDCVCREGVRSPIFAGEYARVRVAVILAGAFHARGSRGAVLVGPGALLLGDAGGGYEYRHVDDGGDRSVVFDYAAPLVDEAGGAFDATCIPASPRSAAAAALARDALERGDAELLHEAALAALETALAGGGAAAAPRLSPRQERQVARALRYVEGHVAGDCSLEALAGVAGLSSFHFLRLFRALTGQTPRQFVIAARLRAAAALLRATRDPISQVAFGAGFGDLSHFHASFTRCFGASPRAYRRR